MELAVDRLQLQFGQLRVQLCPNRRLANLPRIGCPVFAVALRESRDTCACLDAVIFQFRTYALKVSNVRLDRRAKFLSDDGLDGLPALDPSSLEALSQRLTRDGYAMGLLQPLGDGARRIAGGGPLYDLALEPRCKF